MSSRENDGTERGAQGVGGDMSCPRKVCFRRRPHAVLPRSQVFRGTSPAITLNLCFSLKHQTVVGLHADVSEDRLPLEQRHSARLKITFVDMTYPKG